MKMRKRRKTAKSSTKKIVSEKTMNTKGLQAAWTKRRSIHWRTVTKTVLNL